MEKVDLVEIADYCVNRYKESLKNASEKKYVGTLYVAIIDDNIKCSVTPHILKSAAQCILIHETSELAVSNWYSWYSIEYINEDGCVLNNSLDSNFKLAVSFGRSYSQQIMTLSYNDEKLFWFERPWEQFLPKMWELYTNVKGLNSKSEISLIADLFRKDKSIFELKKQVEDLEYSNILLEQERDLYKEILDKIKELL